MRNVSIASTLIIVMLTSLVNFVFAVVNASQRLHASLRQGSRRALSLHGSLEEFLHVGVTFAAIGRLVAGLGVLVTNALLLMPSHATEGLVVVSLVGDLFEHH